MIAQSVLRAEVSRCTIGVKAQNKTIKAGVILAGYYVFNANISFTFQAIKNLYAHLT